MKAQLTAAAAELRGSIAGTTFRNQGSIIVSTKQNAIKRQSSAFQKIKQQRFLFVTRQWRELSKRQQAAWDSIKWKGLSGYSLYMYANATGFIASSISRNPDFSNPLLINVKSISIINDLLTNQFLYRLEIADINKLAVVHVMLSPCIPKTRTTYNKFSTVLRFNVSQPSTITQALNSRYIARYGSLVPNMRVFVKTHIFDFSPTTENFITPALSFTT